MENLAVEYFDWYEGLSNERKSRFDYFSQEGYKITNEKIVFMFLDWGFRMELCEYNYRSFDAFMNGEISEAIKKVTDLELGVLNLSDTLKLSKDGKSDDYFKDEQKRKSFCITSYYILKEIGIVDEVLNSDIKLYDKTETALNGFTGIIPFVKVIHLMYRLGFLQDLLYLNSQDGFVNEMNREYFKNKSAKEEILFDFLFKEKANVAIVKVTLEKYNYTRNGEWKGLTKNKSELLSLYWVLRDGGVLKTGKVQPQVRAFYKEFGLPENFTDPRMTYFGNHFCYDSRITFEKLFSKILPQK